MERPDKHRIPTQVFDLAYQWMPWDIQDRQTEAVNELRHALKPGGHAFVTGPASLGDSWKGAGFTLAWQERVEDLPTFRMHRTILPKARLNDGLTLYFVTAH
jgi:hypothetical protein